MKNSILVRARWWQVLLTDVVLVAIVVAVGYFQSWYLAPIVYFVFGVGVDIIFARLERKFNFHGVASPASRVITVVAWPIITLWDLIVLREEAEFISHL